MDTNWVEAARIVALVTFVAAGVVAFRTWLVTRSPQSTWLAAAFGSLATLLVMSRALRALGVQRNDVAQFFTIFFLLAYPWLLFRFGASFRPVRTRWMQFCDALGVALMASAVLVPMIPDASAGARPAWVEFYVLVLIGVWSLLSFTVAAWLWRSGRGQPVVAKRRMRAMAVGSVLLSIALLTALEGGQRDAAVIGGQLMATAAAIVFVVGFAPPRILRDVWRRPAVAAIRDGEAGLIAATSREQIADILLPAAADFLGSGGAGLFGRDGKAIAVHQLPPDDVLDLEEELRTRTPSNEPVVTAHDAIIPLRTGWLVARSTPYTPFFGDEEFALVQRLALLVDLASNRIELFEAERALRRQLQQTNTELEAIVYGLSHDLRNPLVTILGYLDVLETDYGTALDDQGRHFLSRMRSGASYMDALIRDLLEFSRVGRPSDATAHVPLAAMVTDIVEELQRDHPAAQFVVEPLPDVRMNPTRARQLFTNLLENSLRHSGRQDVELRVQSSRRPGGGVEITVSDNGKGIPPDYRDRIFGIFEQLGGNERRGTGIGLAICRKIVEHAGGAIEAVDPPGTTGARFRITLPAAVLVHREQLETTV